jgi:uncharacterized protein (TIGR01777 family)
VDIAITGASGLIGSSLAAALEAGGDRVIRIVRREAAADEIWWDPARGAIDAPERLEGISAVVHLAGAGIGDKRWTESYKRVVLESRTMSTALVARTVAALEHKPRVLVSASAVGFYGDGGDEPIDEAHPAGDDFLATVCQAWEAATAPAEDAGIRVARIRSGIVLTPRGGALKKMLPLFRLGLGGRFGSGDQWMSWITIDDEIAAIRHLLTSDVRGPVNLTAPEPVRNRDFAKTLGAVLRRPAIVPVPRFGPRLLLGAELGELLFVGQRVHPAVLTASGYEFRHPRLEPALRDLLGR